MRPLDAATRRRLARTPFSYPEVGATEGPLPAGYRHLRRARAVRTTDLDAAARALLGWRTHEQAGLRVAASSPEVAEGVVVVSSVGVGPLRLAAPCRVVYVVDEPRRRGFAYGTLAGHPERGEEAFVLERDDAGRITFTITAFSRPATRAARLAGPLGRLAQSAVTARYLRAADR